MTLNRGRFLLISALVLGLALLYAVPANAVMSLTILEVTGILERIDDSVEPNEIYLNVDGVSASGPMIQDFEFMDARGTRLPQREFVRRYTNQQVTLSLYEHSGEVISGIAVR